MRAAAAAFATLLIGSCQTAQVSKVIPTMLSASQVSAMKSGLAGSLKDPESARFGQFRAGKDNTGTIIVCGWVNAKNSFGGYTGDQPYMGKFSGSSFAPVAVGGDDIVRLSIMQVCAKSGLAI